MEKYRVAELIHSRWAMLAAAGIIIPEGLEANGAPIHGGTWFETGAEMLDGAPSCPCSLSGPAHRDDDSSSA